MSTSPANYEALSTEDVASLFLVSDRQIRTWVKEKDMPCRKDGRTVTFIWRDALAWYVEYKASLERYANVGESTRPEKSDDPTFRRDSAVAGIKELELEQRQGRLVRMDDVLEVFGRVVNEMKTTIRGLPTRMVQQVLSIRDHDEMFAFLTEETDNTLTGLSQLRFDQLPEPEVSTATEDE